VTISRHVVYENRQETVRVLLFFPAAKTENSDLIKNQKNENSKSKNPNENDSIGYDESIENCT